MQVGYTIPEQVRLEDIQEFVINVDGLSVEVHLKGGAHGLVDTTEFLDFWNNTMTDAQRTVVKGFVNQLSSLAKYKVSVSLSDQTGTVTGDLGE